MKKRMRAGAVALLFCACLLLYGCGSETGGSQDPQNEFKIDATSLENQGCKNIADIAYVKLENEGGSTRIRIVYKTKDPVSAFYLLSTIGQEFISAGEDENYIFNWGGQEYDSESIPNDISMDEIYTYYPADWKDVISKHMSQGIDNIVEKSIADEIDRDVDALLADYKKENETEQETEKETEQETESDLKTLNQKIYGAENERVYMSFSIDDNKKYHYSVFCMIEEDWKAAYAFTFYSALASKVENEGINSMAAILCGGVTLSTSGICFDTSSGENETIDPTDWCAKQLMKADSEQREKFSDKLNEYWEDFWDETINKIK